MEKEKKAYEKPMTQKHKAVAMVSGSSSGCSENHSKTTDNGRTYYH